MGLISRVSSRTYRSSLIPFLSSSTMDARSEAGASSVADTEHTDAHSHTTADTVARMKAAVIRKKGRGFDTDVEHTEYSEYDRLEDDDDEVDASDNKEGPGPQRSVEGWILFVRGLHGDC